jgi:hypothetical protein
MLIPGCFERVEVSILHESQASLPETLCQNIKNTKDIYSLINNAPLVEVRNYGVGAFTYS